MNYEKKYEDALERASKLRVQNPFDTVSQMMEHVFPELKESEDERIRKEIISALKYANHKGVYDKHIAWLEKQGEQKPTNKVEPKFKNGQWIVWQNKCYKVNYNGCDYELIDQNGLSTSLEYVTVDENAHLWTIQDAKDGDVLMSRSPFIYGKQCPYGGLDWYNNNFIKASNFIFTDSPVHPATKEQRDLLFQKMKEAGYRFDFEKKELKKLKFRVGDEVKTENEESLTITKIDERGYWSNDLFICDFDNECVWDLVEQKPAWSEEDDYNVQCLVAKVVSDIQNGNVGRNQELIDLLKSLKQKIGG